MALNSVADPEPCPPHGYPQFATQTRPSLSEAMATGALNRYLAPCITRISLPVRAVSSVMEFPNRLATQTWVPSDAIAFGDTKWYDGPWTTLTSPPEVALSSVATDPAVQSPQFASQTWVPSRCDRAGTTQDGFVDHMHQLPGSGARLGDRDHRPRSQPTHAPYQLRLLGDRIP